jgi:N-acetylglucosaminyldiphosphoundecaprenol N-acetyl-beta-D-mannosaminyltransferase
MSFSLYDVHLDHFSHAQLDAILRSWVSGYEQRRVSTPNPEFLLYARNRDWFRDLLNKSHLSIPDGVGLRYAIAALGKGRLMFRHTGVDTLMHLARICEDSGKLLVLFGAEKKRAQKAASALRFDFPELRVVGVDPGKIKEVNGKLQLDESIVLGLHRIEPVVLAVGLGCGKQEKFIEQYLHQLPTVRVAIGVGGAFDMISGHYRRAPGLFQRMGLEFFWRLMQQPSRFTRIWKASVVFPLMVAYDTLRRGRLLRACIAVFPEVARQLRGK